VERRLEPSQDTLDRSGIAQIDPICRARQAGDRYASGCEHVGERPPDPARSTYNQSPFHSDGARARHEASQGIPLCHNYMLKPLSPFQDRR
jgi:hypothetical protein